MHPSDADSCKGWFKQGKSFPDNVRDAVCSVPEAKGPTGPTGPIGPSGLHGGGVDTPAQCENILLGVNGETNDDVYTETYIDPAGWKCASDRYYAQIYTSSIKNETFSPDPLEYNIFDITYEGSCIIAEPSNMENGRTFCMALRQAEGGNHTLSFSTVYEFDGGWDNITLTEGSKDVMVATKINDFYFCTMANDIKQGISQDQSLLNASVITL